MKIGVILVEIAESNNIIIITISVPIIGLLEIVVIIIICYFRKKKLVKSLNRKHLDNLYPKEYLYHHLEWMILVKYWDTSLDLDCIILDLGDWTI